MVHRYAVALGYSMAQSNGDFLKAARVELILLTYYDIKFSEKSIRALKAVGWKMRQVREFISHSSHLIYRAAYIQL